MKLGLIVLVYLATLWGTYYYSQEKIDPIILMSLATVLLGYTIYIYFKLKCEHCRYVGLGIFEESSYECAALSEQIFVKKCSNCKRDTHMALELPGADILLSFITIFVNIYRFIKIKK